jgi:flagella basal body P-ring formation protein FlgA
MDVRRVDTLREREALCASDSAGELTLLRSIPAGRMLSWRDVARRALVRKGEVIEVAAVDGALSVSMKALAMENGSAGEMVRVRNLESKKEFTAQVVSENRAQVRF